MPNRNEFQISRAQTDWHRDREVWTVHDTTCGREVEVSISRELLMNARGPGVVRQYALDDAMLRLEYARNGHHVATRRSCLGTWVFNRREREESFSFDDTLLETLEMPGEEMFPSGTMNAEPSPLARFVKVKPRGSPRLRALP